MQDFLLALPVLLFSMVAHEYAHGYAALKQGDDTALMLGRLTFNPIKHIDPWMTIAFPLILWYTAGFMFGGAKPVPVNPRKYRRYVRGDIIVSSAGVVVNLVLAVLFLGFVILLGLAGGAQARPEGDILGLLQHMAMIGIQLNLLLAFFNLIPIPPLDGSHLLYHALPAAAGARYRALAPYGLIILPLLIFLSPGFFRILLFPAFSLTGAALSVAAPYSLQPAGGW